MDEHPRVTFAGDAAAVQSSPAHRAILNNIVRRFCREKANPQKGIIIEMAPILRDFGKFPDDFDGNEILYIRDKWCADFRSGKISWITPIFLSWLCHYHEPEAVEFYSTAGLSNAGFSHRKYPRIPGAWAAEGVDVVQRHQEPGAIGELNPGPMFQMQIETRESASRRKPDQPLSAVLFPHPNGICNAEFSPCGNFIVTAGKKKRGHTAEVYIWRSNNISELDRKFAIADAIGSHVLTVTFSPDSKYVLWSAKNTAKLSYANAMMEPIFELNHHGQIAHCCFSQTKPQIATASHDKTACVWDSRTGKKLKTMSPRIKGNNYGINSVNFSPDGENLVLAIASGLISIWNIETETEIATLKAENNHWLCGAMYSKDGKRILSAGPEEGSAHIWDLATHKAVIFGGDEAHGDMIWSAAYSPDEELIVTASDDHFAFVWGVKSRSVLMRLPHPDKLWNAHFSPDGNHVLTACHDGYAYLWRIR